MTVRIPTLIVVGLALVTNACATTNSASAPSGSTSPTPPGSAAAGRSEPVGSVNPAPLVEGEPYRPALPDPEEFVAVIDNPYLPLIPGTTSVYEGVSDGQRERNVVGVTHRTKVILGVTTTVVHDQVFTHGELAENTFDWYAQDRFGNVWYFGEDTAEYENGEIVTTEGTWQAGVDGAQPGIAMLGEPMVGQTYRQEFYRGHAEDVGMVLHIDAAVHVPFGRFDQILVTEDRTPLQPKLLENKFYAPGVGLVLERVIAGGEEVSRLVAFSADG